MHKLSRHVDVPVGKRHVEKRGGRGSEGRPSLALHWSGTTGNPFVESLMPISFF
jgi:hypothetical protein